MIGLAVGGLDAQVMRGFNLYRHSVGPWTIADAGHQRAYIDRVLNRAGSIHGVLANVTDRGLADRLRATGLPIVDVSGISAEAGFVRVTADNVAVGRVAAGHFLERGFRRFIFASPQQRSFERERWQGFHEGLAQRFDRPRVGWFLLEGGSWIDEVGQRPLSHAAFYQMLVDADEPVAILAGYDRPGMEICDHCRTLGIAVPEQVAVLGVDDNEYLCESCEPPLSSVMLPGQKIGHEAARLLHAMMDGQPPPDQTILLPPVGVHTRHSTDIAAIDDRGIAQALSIMRQRAAEPINVTDLADAVHMDRRTFYRHFRKAIGRTPLQELDRLRIELARERLVGTHTSIYEIALAVGFADVDRFGRKFKQETGLTPSQFRHRFSVR